MEVLCLCGCHCRRSRRLQPPTNPTGIEPPLTEQPSRPQTMQSGKRPLRPRRSRAFACFRCGSTVFQFPGLLALCFQFLGFADFKCGPTQTTPSRPEGFAGGSPTTSHRPLTPSGHLGCPAPPGEGVAKKGPAGGSNLRISNPHTPHRPLNPSGHVQHVASLVARWPQLLHQAQRPPRLWPPLALSCRNKMRVSATIFKFENLMCVFNILFISIFDTFSILHFPHKTDFRFLGGWMPDLNNDRPQCRPPPLSPSFQLPEKDGCRAASPST